MTERNVSIIKTTHVAGIPQEVFQTLTSEDKAFLQLLERQGLDLESVYQKAISGGAKC
jgi:hypothetical protein